MTRPESYDELIRTEIRKMRPTKTYPYDPVFPYAVLNVFSDEEIARFRHESDAVDFAYEDLTLYVIDTTPQGGHMTDKTYPYDPDLPYVVEMDGVMVARTHMPQHANWIASGYIKQPRIIDTTPKERHD